MAQTEMTTALEKASDFRRDIKVSAELNERLESVMFGIGIKTKTEALERLLNEFGKKMDPGVFQSKVATLENVLADLAPCCIYGKPGAGKSTTMKKLVIEAGLAGMSVIVIDVANEYGDLPNIRKVSASSAVTRRFKDGAGKLYRIVPDRDPRQRQFSIQRVFEHLNMLALKGKLQNFFIGIDEGNELRGIKELEDFLIESRKFVRKAVIVSADPEPYEKICVLMRPRPKTPSCFSLNKSEAKPGSRSFKQTSQSVALR